MSFEQCALLMPRAAGDCATVVLAGAPGKTCDRRTNCRCFSLARSGRRDIDVVLAVHIEYWVLL
jgi:hypothetical protein